jgi:starch synthase
MTILFAASEMDLLARTGGLGDVIEALPAALAARGHEVSVVLPFYRAIREREDLKINATGVRITVSVGSKQLEAEIHECTAPNGVQVFLVRRDEYFDRSGLYGGDDGRAYDDNAERFIYFSRAVVELARRILPPPDVIHVHDWQTALIPVLIRERRLPFKTVLTIHNLAFQGNFWAYDFGLTNLPGHYFSAEGIEFYGNVNLLKGGILFADAITTVSERYAREIQTPEFGFGLDAVLRQHAGKLSGILNGADYSIWNPATDKLLPANYSPQDLSGKRHCRDALLTRLELDSNPEGPVYSMVSRLAAQKGIDLLLPIIDRLLADDARLVVLGEGDPAFERELTIACKQHRGRFSFHDELDTELSHLIEGGADISFIPSFYEPCGLAAMYGLKYGTLPIARATGGLHEIIRDVDPTTGTGTGFLFFDPTPEAFWDTITRARQLFRDSAQWQELMRRAMEADFSWEKAVERYEALFRGLVRGRK